LKDVSSSNWDLVKISNSFSFAVVYSVLNKLEDSFLRILESGLKYTFAEFLVLKEILVVMETFEQYYRLAGMISQVIYVTEKASVGVPFLRDLILSFARRNHSVFVCHKALMDGLRLRLKVQENEVQVYGFSSEFLVDLGVLSYSFGLDESAMDVDQSTVSFQEQQIKDLLLQSSFDSHKFSSFAIKSRLSELGIMQKFMKVAFLVLDKAYHQV
jgi:hypothetical protein